MHRYATSRLFVLLIRREKVGAAVSFPLQLNR